MISMNLADKLHMLARRKRLSRMAIAKEVGDISKSTIYNWFNGDGKPDLDSALKIARVLGVDLDYLADDTRDQPPTPLLTKEEEGVLDMVRIVGIPDAKRRLLRAAKEANQAKRSRDGIAGRVPQSLEWDPSALAEDAGPDDDAPQPWRKSKE